ncbi:glycosyltransferase family 4 protein [Bacillus sp. SA1-12]|uniref:glycosyltransferase family 4 protein n=1 Tax=Bacillus sp. SA1-12 TaxID=1455638 RepID=UPI0018CC90DE|nr:glycosyltransferase family 4 protein [Bacillus sp. SA1-12]
MNKTKICMVVQDRMVKGGIAAVINGYRGSKLETDYNIQYVESYKDGGKFKKLLKAISGYFHFAKVLLVDKPELVHIHSSFGPSFYRKIPFIYMASWAKKPIINHCHGADFDSFYLDASEKKKRLVEKVYNKCSVMIALSEEWKARLRMIVPSEKVVVIENYSTICENSLADRLNRKCNNQILFLGEIGHRKGGYDIPAVVESLAQSVPDAKFVLGGAGDVQQVTELLKSRKVEAKVAFPGWVRGDEKDRLLRESDIFFLPSYNEGMPMSILDAMGYGLPIVSTNVGGIPKIVKNNYNGYLCEAGDKEGFAEAIRSILTDESKRISMGKASFQIVIDGYSLETHISKLESIYEKYSNSKC